MKQTKSGSPKTSTARLSQTALHVIVFSDNKCLEDPNLSEAYDATINAMKLTSDFYQILTDHYEGKASSLAQHFAAQVKGKSIRNVDKAFKSL